VAGAARSAAVPLLATEADPIPVVDDRQLTLPLELSDESAGGIVLPFVRPADRALPPV
jgi:hypothetical protein